MVEGIEVADGFPRFEAIGIENEVGRRFFLAHVRQVSRVGTVVSADYQHEIRRLLKQLDQGVLTLLGGPTNRVENAEILI